MAENSLSRTDRSPMFPTWMLHFGAFAGYVVLALVYTHPLILRFSTHFLGAHGDNEHTIWNMWYFSHALRELGTNPLWTDLQYWPYGANLILPHYTLSADIIAYYLMPFWGLVTTYNFLFFFTFVFAGYGVFLLAYETGCTAIAAFVAGSTYAFSPYMVWTLEHGGGLDASSISVLPFFLLAFWRSIQGGRLRDIFFAAVTLTCVWSLHYYDFIFCVLLIAVFFLWEQRPLTLKFTSRPPAPPRESSARFLGLCLLAAGIWVVLSIHAGQKEFHGRGSFWQLLAYTTPYLVFWGLAGLWLLRRHSIGPKWNGAAFQFRAAYPYAGILCLWVLLNLPLVVSCALMIASGDYGSVPHAWRSGGNPTELTSLFLPQDYHPLWGAWIRAHLCPEVPGLGLGLIAGVLWLWRHRSENRRTSLWFTGLVFSLLMSLGPWLKLFGTHTYLPLPFFFLHLLPVLDNIQNGHRFILFIRLFSSILFADFLGQAQHRVPKRLAPWLPALAFILIAFEFAPGKRSMFQIQTTPLIRRLGDLPEGGVLTVPFGANFDGIAGGFMGRMLLDTSQQMIHKKPIVGGSFCRVARRVYNVMHANPFLQALIAAQSGGMPADCLLDASAVARHLDHLRVRYVLVDRASIPAALGRAIHRWPVRPIDGEGTRQLYSFGERGRRSATSSLPARGPGTFRIPP